ncbi:MAG: 30S ribosomal protein S20 [Candidatus Magasanikbacteria bacterium GW2011_GWC2_34_16]|uniref:Small ribosomal subunit protein bS20 n=2 Tax=Candidatus Magasanikiibacteriota TaxID=1752731 RepID=A0A0G0KKA6_9BACT|nr:MAG: 30S ribosomal protein S20 [Candidatus Magasanikbacteria bacterium GW2011_GWC2_34_16]KKQ41041.1 MAG: 30S ribosomal protein S20 [Candidatus Magasanikbacteria bacterium GW2011_GWA2_37_8]
MPNKDNAKKALRQSIKRAALNKAKKEAFRDAIKKTAKAASAEEAKKLVITAQKALDKAAKHGTIKKNTAARRLSRLMKKVNGLAKK